MAVAKKQILEVLQVLLRHVCPSDAGRLLVELRTTQAHQHNRSFRDTVNRLGDEFWLAVALRAVQLMSEDNGCMFLCAGPELDRLAHGLRWMQNDGCSLTSEVMTDLTCGEVAERQHRFSRYSGWKEVDKVLAEIFNGEP